MDSCYSGGTVISARESSSKGRIEIIAACGYSELTILPGRNFLIFTQALVDELDRWLETNIQHPFTAANLHRGMSERMIWNGLNRRETRYLPTPEEIQEMEARGESYTTDQYVYLPQTPVYFNLCDDFRQPSIPLKPLPINNHPQRIDGVNDRYIDVPRPAPWHGRRNISRHWDSGQTPEDTNSAADGGRYFQATNSRETTT